MPVSAIVFDLDETLVDNASRRMERYGRVFSYVADRDRRVSVPNCLPPSREVAPSPRIIEAILATLSERDVPFVMGKTWTTDALYRETRAKAARRVAEGCVCVEMEAAACFAVAQFRDVSFGQMLYAGDDLSGEIWDDRGWIGHATGREAIFRLAVDAITRVPV